MSALLSRPPMGAGFVASKPTTSGFLHIARHGKGAAAMYTITYHRLDGKVDRSQPRTIPLPVVAQNPQSLIELLERIGVDLGLGEVRGALSDILRFGSANIPDMWVRSDTAEES
jgi:hypothetical protein